MLQLFIGGGILYYVGHKDSEVFTSPQPTTGKTSDGFFTTRHAADDVKKILDRLINEEAVKSLSEANVIMCHL
ncbi:hypothetical protein ACFLY0_02125 [Patescibacteria group bacterium]